MDGTRRPSLPRPIRILSFLFVGLLTSTAGGCQPDHRAAEEPAFPPPETLDPPGFLEGLPILGVDGELTVEGFPADLGAIRWLGESPGGLIAVSQAQDHLVRVLDSSGVGLGSVGGAAVDVSPAVGGASGGQGGWVGDTLWVNDVTLGRIVLYSRNLDLLRTLRPLAELRPQAGEEESYPVFLSVTPVAMYPGDTLLVLARHPLESGPGVPFRSGIHLFRTLPDARIRSHVLWIPQDPGPGSTVFGLGRGGAADDPESRAVSRRAHDRVIWDVAPGGEGAGLIIVEPEERGERGWRLHVVDAQGRFVVNRRYPMAGEPGDGGSWRVPQAVLLGADGRIWIHFTPEGRDGFWLVLDPDGNPRARVPGPPDARLLAAGEDGLWLEEPNEQGVPTLVRYRLRDEDDAGGGEAVGPGPES